MMGKAFTFLVIMVALVALTPGKQVNAQNVNVYQPVETTLYSGSLPTQYSALPTLFNPAATGNSDFIRIRGGARLDYLGSHESPKNFFATGDSPFKIGKERIGAGVVISSMNYGLYRNLNLRAQGSYKFKIKNSYISAGIGIGYFHANFKGSEYKITLPGHQPEEGEDEIPDEDDMPEYPTQDVGGGAIDLSAGIRFDHPLFYAAVSMLHITSPKIKLTKDKESSGASPYIEGKLPARLYFEGGGNIGINNSLFTLQPSVLIDTDFKGLDGVVVMQATYNRRFSFGLDYRYNRAVGVLAGITIKDFYVGYNWEYDYKNKPRGSTGNHEIVLGYQFKMDMGGKNKFSHRSIRIM